MISRGGLKGVPEPGVGDTIARQPHETGIQGARDGDRIRAGAEVISCESKPLSQWPYSSREHGFLVGSLVPTSYTVKISLPCSPSIPPRRSEFTLEPLISCQSFADGQVHPYYLGAFRMHIAVTISSPLHYPSHACLLDCGNLGCLGCILHAEHN